MITLWQKTSFQFWKQSVSIVWSWTPMILFLGWTIALCNFNLAKKYKIQVFIGKTKQSTVSIKENGDRRGYSKWQMWKYIFKIDETDKNHWHIKNTSNSSVSSFSPCTAHARSPPRKGAGLGSSVPVQCMRRALRSHSYAEISTSKVMVWRGGASGCD